MLSVIFYFGVFKVVELIPYALIFLQANHIVSQALSVNLLFVS